MKGKKVKTQQNFYYSSLTVFLLISTIFLITTVVFNVFKAISYQRKLVELQTTYQEAMDIQRRLKAEIDSFNSPEAYEAFARNYLNMVGKNEIKVIIIPKKK